jgi:hypothetical protein
MFEGGRERRKKVGSRERNREVDGEERARKRHTLS